MEKNVDALAPGDRIGAALTVGDITLNPRTGLLTGPGPRRLALVTRDTRILGVLLSFYPEVAPRGVLSEAFSDNAGSPNYIALATYIQRLREKLAVVGSGVSIITRRGSGYLIVLPVGAAAAPDANANLPTQVALMDGIGRG